MRVRMIIVSCRRPFAVRPLLLLLAGIRSKIVPPSQYTHHNRLLYPLLRFKTLPNAYRINVRTRGTSSISTLRPNLTRVSCCTLYEAMLILETPDTLTSTYCSRNTTLWKLHQNSSETYVIRFAHSFFSLIEKRAGKIFRNMHR